MADVRRRAPLNYASPENQPVGLNPSAAWIICSFAFLFLAGEIASLIGSVHSVRRGSIALWFTLFILCALPASLLGLFGFRAARLSGSKTAGAFAVVILGGVALGMGGMLALIFCGLA